MAIFNSYVNLPEGMLSNILGKKSQSQMNLCGRCCGWLRNPAPIWMVQSLFQYWDKPLINWWFGFRWPIHCIFVYFLVFFRATIFMLIVCPVGFTVANFPKDWKLLRFPTEDAWDRSNDFWNGWMVSPWWKRTSELGDSGRNSLSLAFFWDNFEGSRS